VIEPGGGRASTLTNHLFTDLAEAAWFVFEARWLELAGEDLPIE